MKSLQLSAPHIIAMVGIPGAGKTQFATEFAEMFHAPRLDSDILSELSGDAAAVDATAGTLLKELMKTRQTVVFEGATERRVWRAELMKLAQQAGYKVLFVWVQTDAVTAKQRWLKLRRKDEASFQHKLSQFSAPHTSEPYVVISGRHTYSTQARAVLTRLSATSRPSTAQRVTSDPYGRATA